MLVPSNLSPGLKQNSIFFAPQFLANMDSYQTNSRQFGVKEASAVLAVGSMLFCAWSFTTVQGASTSLAAAPVVQSQAMHKVAPPAFAPTPVRYPASAKSVGVAATGAHMPPSSSQPLMAVNEASYHSEVFARTMLDMSCLCSTLHPDPCYNKRLQRD